MSNKAKLEKVISRNPKCFGTKNRRIFVKLEGLSKMQKAIHKLTEDLLNKSVQLVANMPAG